MRIGIVAALAAACVALVLASGRELAAGTVEKLDLAGLVERAEIAVHGRVTETRVELDARGRPVTAVRLAVERTFFGVTSGELAFRVPGGMLPDKSGMLIPGLPSVARGEELLLFLSAESKLGLRLPVGLAQGKYRVLRDAQGVRKLVREASELKLVAAGRASSDAGAVLDFDATAAEIERLAGAKRAKLGGKQR